MKNKSRKTGHFIGEVLIGLLFLFAVVGIFLWSVNRIVSSIEYKKSADVRTVTARVIDYDIKNSDDEYDDYDEYVTKLSYEVDGIKYTGKRTYYREVSIGDEKKCRSLSDTKRQIQNERRRRPFNVPSGLHRSSGRPSSYIYRRHGSCTNNCRPL